MTQTPCVRVSKGDRVDHTFAADAKAGIVIVVGNTPMIVPSEVDYSVQPIGELDVSRAVWDIPQDATIKTAGEKVYWDADGDPYGGDASSGAATSVSAGNTLLGIVAPTHGNGTTASTATDTYVRVVTHVAQALATVVRLPVTTTVVGGTAIGNANSIVEGMNIVTGADDTAAVKLPEAAAGKMVYLKSTTASKNLVVFPAVSDKINAGAANASYNFIDDVGSALFIAADDEVWYTLPLAP